MDNLEQIYNRYKSESEQQAFQEANQQAAGPFLGQPLFFSFSK
ncbi:hypothetical protein [Aneurinibacillus terranovensis]|nr:hypothetical protein [Aneurinibacillus terranovensis]